MQIRPFLTAFFYCAVAASLAGCTSIGPRGIELSRTDFNVAIQRTDAEQLLLNVVRQRYSDPVLFLDISSVSSSMSRSANLSLSGFFPQGLGSDSYNGGVGGSFSESPLVFYSPNTGERFVRQMLTPIDLRTLSLLLQSGWSIERVLLLGGESIAGLSNSATGDDSFRKLVDQFRILQRTEQLSFALETYGTVDVLVIIPAASATTTAAYLEVCRLLQILPDGKPIRMQRAVGSRDATGNYLSIVTRSLFSSLYYLSNGVEPPVADTTSGVLQPRAIRGGIFDGGDLFKVRSSDSMPTNAAIRVRYRDRWFYVPDSDPDTRTTFALLSILLLLQSSDTTKMSPLISLSPSR